MALPDPTKEEREWIKFHSLNDSIGFTDDGWTKFEREWIKFKTLPDSISIADVPTKTEREWIKFKTIPDSISIGDVPITEEREWKKFVTALETLSIQDVPTKFERIWIYFNTVNETITLIDLSTETEGASISDNMGISDSWAVSKAFPSIGYLLDGGGESLKSKWNTGWISPTDLSKNPIIRRINMDYKSDDDITMKVYSNDDITTPVATKTFPSSSSSTHGSIRLGARVKYFLLSIETAQSSNADVKIERIEIEVDT